MKSSRFTAKITAIFLSLTLVAALCLGLSGCGDDSSPTEPDYTGETSSEAVPVVDPDAVVSTASILSTGDILIHSPFLTAYYDEEKDAYDFREIFQFVKNYVQKADYAVANLEVSLGGEEAGEYSGYPNFNCPDAIVDALVDAGFDMLLTSNNHVGDTGIEGFNRTQSVLTDKGVSWMGTVADATDKRYQVVDVNGIKIGMVNYSYITSDEDEIYLNGVPISKEFADRLNTFDYGDMDTFYTNMEQCMADMKADGAEATIMYIHWGEEYHLEPVDYQKTIAQKLCDIGFDAIIGGHPHVIEPTEVLTSTETGKRTICLYSMGNEISNQRHELMEEDIETSHTEDGLLFYTNFSKKGDGSVELTSVDVIPTWVHMYYDDNDRRTYEIMPLDKSADWADFNASATDTGADEAEASYERTMDLVGKGIEEYNSARSAVTGVSGTASNSSETSSDTTTDTTSSETTSTASDTESGTASTPSSPAFSNTTTSARSIFDIIPMMGLGTESSNSSGSIYDIIPKIDPTAKVTPSLNTVSNATSSTTSSTTSSDTSSDTSSTPSDDDTSSTDTDTDENTESESESSSGTVSDTSSTVSSTPAPSVTPGTNPGSGIEFDALFNIRDLFHFNYFFTIRPTQW